MSSGLQLDVCNLNLWRRHLVNAYEVKAGIGVLQVKLCDPRLSALRVLQKWALYKYTYLYLFCPLLLLDLDLWPRRPLTSNAYQVVVLFRYICRVHYNLSTLQVSAYCRPTARLWCSVLDCIAIRSSVLAPFVSNLCVASWLDLWPLTEK